MVSRPWPEKMTKGGESPDEAGLEHQVAALPCNSDRGSRHTTCEQRQTITRCATVCVDPEHHIVLQRSLPPVALHTSAVDTRTGPNRVHGRGTEMSILASLLETTAPASTETSVLAVPGRSPGRWRLPAGIRLTPVVRNFMVPPLRRASEGMRRAAGCPRPRIEPCQLETGSRARSSAAGNQQTRRSPKGRSVERSAADVCDFFSGDFSFPAPGGPEP